VSVVTLAGQPSRAQCIALEGEDIADSTVHEQVHKRCGVDRRFIGPEVMNWGGMERISPQVTPRLTNILARR